MEDNNELIKEIQNQCKYFANDIVTRLCKRAIRKMKAWEIKIGEDNYPESFNFFDILSIECQSKCYDEISPCLKDAIEGVLDNEYDNLLPQERFFVDYSRCYYDNGYDPISVKQLIYKRFNELLNEHWRIKKISNFEESRSW